MLQRRVFENNLSSIKSELSEIKKRDTPLKYLREDSENISTENLDPNSHTTKRVARRKLRGGKSSSLYGRGRSKSPHEEAIANGTTSDEEVKTNGDVSPKSSKAVKIMESNIRLAKEKHEATSSSNWMNTGLVIVVELVLIVVAVLMLSPTYETPTCTSKPFFHTVTEGEPVSFQIELGGWPEPSCQWRLNGVDIPGATNKRLRISQAKLSDSGTYTCLIENIAGHFVWEEGYINVMEKQTSAPSASSHTTHSTDHRKKDESKRLATARACLLARAPEPVRQSASMDGGAAVIAAGETAGYLDCFEGLKSTLPASVNNVEARKHKQLRALDVLRSLHGSSNQRDLLVNIVTALDELVLAKRSGASSESIENLAARVAFEAGLYCASTPQCANDNSDTSKTRVVTLVMNALTGSGPDAFL